MSRRRHATEQIIRKLAEGQKLLAGGMDLEGVCRQLEIAESTWARWLAQYGGVKADEAKRLAELDESMLTELAEGNFCPRTAKRTAVIMLCARFGVSERRACKVVGQHRSTQRLDPPEPPDDDSELRDLLRAFSKRRPRWGWRLSAKELRRTGWQVTNKRVRRLWRDEGLQMPTKCRRKRLSGVGANVGDMSLIAPDALGALDFQFAHTIDHWQVKMLNIIDDYTRENLDIRVEHSITADDVVAVLDRLAIERGHPPAFLRFDNGPEFVSIVVAEWCASNGTQCVFIDPGSPWQNAWIESFNSRLRDELLNLWQFDRLLEAQVLIGDWRIDYNENRPHSARGDLTPIEFAQAWTNKNTKQPQAA